VVPCAILLSDHKPGVRVRCWCSIA